MRARVHESGVAACGDSVGFRSMSLGCAANSGSWSNMALQLARLSRLPPLNHWGWRQGEALRIQASSSSFNRPVAPLALPEQARGVSERLGATGGRSLPPIMCARARVGVEAQHACHERPSHVARVFGGAWRERECAIAPWGSPPPHVLGFFLPEETG